MLQAWLLAARPATLTAALVPVMVGAAVAFAENGFALVPVLAALFGAMAIQVGTNFANDVFDFEKGADTEDRLGPVRAVQAGLLTPGQMRQGMYVAFGLAVVAGIYLTVVAGPTIILIGVASIISGIAYTAGPYPLAYVGLGDVFVMLFFGFVAVMGTIFVQTGTWSMLGALAAAPIGALSTGVLVVNNVRDRQQDVLVNKRTLAVRFGRKFAEVEYAVLLVVAYGVPALLLYQGRGVQILLPLLTLPGGLILLRQLRTREGTPLNPVLAGTAKLSLAFGVLLSLGLVL